ncbi:hypothetical protein EXU85_00575 [Spirosoma sp. KCTC 42546]|uniref:hypothetical protein n=1 Tax=Spirosoma sp. KCTC 42546 TaxID=2520506 RepID=UPI001157E944|nr:hypothetical protein [Spirosoma sp. KCTC 42546]QDK77166.1 hypothetical protein EXU85_00575 [Spirosoma sp. KCTC 42546]
MKLKSIVDQLQHEANVVQGEATKDSIYVSHTTFPDELAAGAAFGSSVAKLLNVNGWSALSSISADFALYSPVGKSKPDGPVDVGDFIQILLPGPTPENWVRVIHKSLDKTRAEFTVQPSPDPMANKPDQIEHFFNDQARSTFRVEVAGCTLSAFQIGKQEGINNQQPQAGDRALVNTLIAETGWLFYQKIQWQLLTDYLVLS